MNKQRRTIISNIINKLMLCLDEIEKVKDEEEDVFDNMPENLQDSIRGQDSQNSIDILEESIDSLSEIIDELRGI